MIGGACIAAVLAVWVTEPLRNNLVRLLTDLLVFAASLSAFWRSFSETSESRGWRILGLAFLLVALDGLSTSLSAIGLFPLPKTTPPAALVLLCNTGLLALGLLAWPLSPSTGREKRRKTLDGLIFGASFFFIVWGLVVGKIFQGSAISVGARSYLLLFSFAYGVLLGIAVYLGAQAPERFRGPLGWMTAGALMACMGHLVWAALTMRGRWYSTHPWNHTTVIYAFCFLMSSWSSRSVEGPFRADPARSTHPLLELLLPYLPPLGALGVGAIELLRNQGDLDRVAGWIMLVLLVLLILRQFLALRDLQLFSQFLEQRVQERTRALEESQAVLMRNQRMNIVATLGAGLAHDFKNLLNIIRGMSGLVQTDYEEGRTPDPEDFKAIQSASVQAGEMASHLMDLGRELSSELRLFDLSEQVQEFQPLLKRLVPKNIDVLQEFEPVHLPVMADPLQVEQILVNLVSNARDAMPEGGTILIRTGLDLDPALQTPRARLEIQDDGMGMAPDVLKRIFEPFFSTKAPGHGTGLGLASVKTIVEPWAGQIEAHSELGRGTTFSLLIPLAAPEG